MATIGSGTPLLYVEGVATNVSGSGNTRTVKITAKFKVNGSSASWYGYACNWRARVNNSYGNWTAIKGTESWNGGEGLRTFEQTLTVDVGTTSSKAITVGIYTDSLIDSGWDGSYVWTHTVGSTNVAPVLSGTVTTSPSGTISENTASITVTSPTATDANGNLSGYRCRVSINGGGYTEIYKGSSRSFTHNVSNYGQGTTFKYVFDAYDSAGAWSGNVYSAVVTKNTFTGDSLSSSSSIAFSTASISFTYSGASNTSGNTSFTRKLTCDGITVYNNTLTSSPATVTIYKSGTVPSGPYIKFDDIKSKFKSANYKGNLSFTLTTTNTYKTSKTSLKTISVNLQVAPTAVGSCSIATDTNSTAYVSVTTSSGTSKYFIPDGSKVVRVNWTAGKGQLGESINYDLYVAYGTGSWQLVASNLTSLYYNHTVPKQSTSQAIKYKVRTKCVYNTTLIADRDTAAQTLHYYSGVSLTQGVITRGATTVDVAVTVKSSSSITGLTTKGTAILYNKGTTTQVGSTVTLTTSQAAQTLKFTGLTDAGQYDLKVTYNDGSGLTASNLVATIAIGANSPIFFVNKYGIGVNGLKASAAYPLNVKGSIGIQDPTGTHKAGGIFTYTGDANGMGMAIQSGGAMVIGGGESPKAFIETLSSKATEMMYITSDSNIDFITNCQTIASRKHTGRMTTTGNLHVAGDYYAWSDYGSTMSRVYHQGFKPTAADVGARPSTWTPTATEVGAYSKVNNTSYWGISVNGSEATYVRTPVSGILPNVSNGASGNGGSNLGTSAWRFASVWATQANAEKYRIPASTYAAFGYEASSTDVYLANHVNNWFRLKADKSLTYAGYAVYNAYTHGKIDIVATRVSNLNTRLASGWYAWSSGATGAPASYGVMLVMQWSTNADFCQIAVSTGNSMWTRWYVNGAWTSWIAK